MTLTKLIWQLYPNALDCGMDPVAFWGYSLAEIRDLLESYARMERRRIKEQIVARFQLADRVGLHIQRLFDNKNTITLPYPWDLYPELFAEEKTAFEVQQQTEQLEQFKASRKAYAERYNAMRREQGME